MIGGERITALGKHSSEAVTSEPACVFFPTVMQGRA